jgi:hypothetical protein
MLAGGIAPDTGRERGTQLTTSCRPHASVQSSAPINLSRERESTAGCSQFFARSGSMKFDRNGSVKAAVSLTRRKC